ncbi:hypothetical protein KUL72_30905 [Bradyrhizobium arachidis]|nr:hypothetical protein KUL72_30905 [Bradyrhizobium arachidis]
MLPSHDIEYLNARAPGHQVTAEGGVICVLVPSYPLPKGFDQEASDLLIRLAPGYPDFPSNVRKLPCTLSMRIGLLPSFSMMTSATFCFVPAYCGIASLPRTNPIITRCEMLCRPSSANR